MAGGLGFTSNEGEVLKKVGTTSQNSPEGIASIYADIVAGREAEVDVISGSVVCTVQKGDVSAPTHKVIMSIIHVLEGKETRAP